MKTIKMRIYGMTCNDCVATVEKGLKSVDGVLWVSVSLPDGSAVVKVDDSVDPEKLEDAEVFKKTRYRGEVRDVE
ncbi:mercuric transport protein [Thermoplasma volcanium GSS1]|uniref:Mercuric transport protein n=1 Tax=Thermoplasma volcanium (strain ATCC 51530 / DSM 4299 / JCM 9571 / NBRC 15438 / GSS1) TaxID=273116 RepID=Q97C53_THEVO|nr:heavy-metal-associated domain-containing protein [Thermoplasma volcanium]BAB59394.1 mercuric transport protein [Thermoplasma volcanium GSS1]